jgi:hypothetical protein
VTVSTTKASDVFPGNGVATGFDCEWRIFEETDVRVSLVDQATGADTPLVLNTDYTISGAGDQAGFTVGTVSPVATGTSLYVRRAIPYTQPTDFTNQGAFFPTMHEDAMDRLEMQIQQQTDDLGRTLKSNAVTGNFDLGGRTITGAADATSVDGLPPLSQVQQLVTGAAGSIIPANVALYSRLSSSSAGEGAALIGWPAGFGINQPATNTFFAQSGAAIQRLNDRVFVGGATENDGLFPDVERDWLSIYQHTLTTPDGGSIAPAVRSSQFASLTNQHDASTFGLLGASQTKNFLSASAACIGVSGYAIANNTTYNAKAWAYYGEAHRVGASTALVYGMELDTFTAGASISPTPYSQGDVIGLQIGCGANASGGVDGSAAIQIVGNRYKVKAGIVIAADAITGTDGVTGSGVAISMAKGHALQWYASGGALTGRIIAVGTTNSNSPQLQLGDAAINMQSRSNGFLQHIFDISDTAVNCLRYSSAAAGAAPQLAVGGSDANINLALIPKGTGGVQFGTYTAGAPVAAGYITIKDQAGNVRKLLCA